MIQNWELVANLPQYSSDDFFIVYPRDKKIFAPGEKVFLKVGFSENVGRPNSIHVVLPDYVLTDEQANGQYELLIPKDRSSGNLEIIVMAEWGEFNAPQILSKTLFLEIKG